VELDRLTDSIRTILDALLGRKLDYLARYPVRVVAQDVAGRVDVVPDDPRIPGMSGLPLYTGIPGVTIDLRDALTGEIPGEVRALVGFTGGDPTRPFAEVWGIGIASQIVLRTTSKVTLEAKELRLGSTALRGVARLGDTVQAGPYAGVITSASTTVTAQD
jgi:hypothetical protein